MLIYVYIYAHIIRRLRICTHIIHHGLGFLALHRKKLKTPTSETSVVACSESQVLTHQMKLSTMSTHQGRTPQVEFWAAKFQSKRSVSVHRKTWLFPFQKWCFPKRCSSFTLPRPRPGECQLDLGLHETRSHGVVFRISWGKVSHEVAKQPSLKFRFF